MQNKAANYSKNINSSLSQIENGVALLMLQSKDKYKIMAGKNGKRNQNKNSG
jgi:hypothetical protein